MAYIRTVDPAAAEGRLKREYDNAVKRAGRVFNVLRIQSLFPPAMSASIHLYQALMLGPGPLERAVREMIATAVSAEVDCFY